MTVRSEIWYQTQVQADRVRDLGQAVELPFIATVSDFGNPEPMRNADGRPFAETHFPWLEPAFRYWEDRCAALHSPFLKAARLISEPFYYSGGALHTWRLSRLLESVDCSQLRGSERKYEAIIAPVHLSRGIIGAVIWAGWPPAGVKMVYEKHAADLHMAALRFISSHAEAVGTLQPVRSTLALTRREAQCLKWAAVGKTDVEVAAIMSISWATVRFHLRNASAKLGASSRSQAIQYAVSLGFVGSRPDSRWG